MSIFDTRWSWADVFATLLDRTVQPGGTLAPQDDFVAPVEPVISGPDSPTPVEGLPMLPYDKLDAQCRVVDMRQVAKAGRGRARGTREIEDIDTIWLHQTAAMLMTPGRFKKVPVQRAVPVLAQAVLLHPIRAYMYGGGKVNRRAIHYEIACRAAGIEGDGRTVWISRKDKKAGRRWDDVVAEATDDQIAIAKLMIAYDIAEVFRQGGKIKYIGSHRQSSKQRESDPGQRLWVELGEWAIEEFGLERSREFGNGRPNPTVWTGEGAEPYNWRVRGF